MKLSGVPGGTVLGSRATWTIQEPSGSRECSRCSLCACARWADMRNGRASAPTINEARTTPLTFIGLLSPFVWLFILIIRFVLSLFVCCFRCCQAVRAWLWFTFHWLLQDDEGRVTGAGSNRAERERTAQNGDRPTVRINYDSFLGPAQTE